MHIKSDKLCAICYYDADNPGCDGIDCINCDVGGEQSCRCLTINDGQPCPYFKPLHPTEHIEEPDYDEILHTFF